MYNSQNNSIFLNSFMFNNVLSFRSTIKSEDKFVNYYFYKEQKENIIEGLTPRQSLGNFYLVGLQVKRTDNLGRLYVLIDATCLISNSLSPFLSLSLSLTLVLSLSTLI